MMMLVTATANIYFFGLPANGGSFAGVSLPSENIDFKFEDLLKYKLTRQQQQQQ